MSFSRKLVLGLVVVAVVPVTLLGIFSLTYVEREVSARVDKAQAQSAFLTAAAVDRFCRDVIRSLKLSIDMIPFEEFPADKLGLALQIPFRQFEFLNVIVLLNDKGRPLNAPVHQPLSVRIGAGGQREPTTAADARQFRKHVPLADALKRRQAFGRVYFSQRTRKPRVAIAIAFKRQSGKRLVLAAEVSLGHLDKQLRNVTRAGSSSAFLVDGTGRVIVRAGASAPRLGASGQSLAPVSRGLATRRTHSGRFELPGQGRMLGSFAPVATTGWGVVVAQPQKAAYASVTRIRRYTLFWAVLCLAIAIFAGVWFARGISGPVRELAAAAEQISQGNYRQQIKVRSSDEVGRLAANFNDMATAVEYAIVTIQQQTQQLRESEESYRTLVETSPNAIVRCSRDGVITQSNTQTAELLNVDVEDLRGTPLMDLVQLGGGEGQPPAPGRVPAFLEAPTQDLEFTFRRPTGGPGRGTLSTTPIHRPDGQLEGCVAILRDVTAWRELQARLAQSDRLASVGMLAAGVAHEINNPLTYVLGNLEILEAQLKESRVIAAEPRSANAAFLESPTDSLEELLEDALEGADRIREIVADLKLFSRAESALDEPVKVNQVVASALKMARSQIRHRARTATQFGDIPEVVANEGKLSQVFLNLLINAAQAIPEGDAARNEICIRTWAEGDNVLTEIRDTGAGIAPEVLDRLFDPFFTTKNPAVGTGLGLAICHGIVTGYGGHIDVQSVLGEGSRFTVVLPRWAHKPATSVPEARPKPELSGRRARLLVVDDEPSVGRLAGRMLAQQHDVRVARSGSEAIALLEVDAAYDLILTDLLMPEVTGADLYGWCSKHAPELVERMVFMTGGVHSDASLAFLEGIRNPRLEKPFDASRLRELIERALKAVGFREPAARARGVQRQDPRS